LSARTKARKRAIDSIFAADIRKTPPLELLDMSKEQMVGHQNQDEIFDYASILVQGVVEKHGEIDDQIETFSQGWSLERMPALDKAILRVALWEILFNDEVPDAVAIDEAVEIAKEYSTDDSGSFINGLLARISSTK
jgi:N utilization substance protein B